MMLIEVISKQKKKLFVIVDILLTFFFGYHFFKALIYKL